MKAPIDLGRSELAEAARRLSDAIEAGQSHQRMLNGLRDMEDCNPLKCALSATDSQR